METIAEKDMPAPRLELRWRDIPRNERGYCVECIYSLVLSLDRYDIRAERYDDDGNQLDGKNTELSIEIGKTFSDGEAAKRLRGNRIDTPFRDGAHAQWDSKQLGNLPIYAVADGRAMLVEPTP